MTWKYNVRKRVNVGPLFFYLTPRGISSWGWQVGKWTRNVTHDTDTINTPGPGSIRRRRRR